MTTKDLLIAIFATLTTLAIIEIRRNKTLKNYTIKKRKSMQDLTTLENFSGLLGKQYLYLQEDNITYHNRYTDEYMSAEDAEHWLYGELSSIITRM